MKIIVFAPADDNHTAPIKWALEKADYRVVCWDGLGWTGERQSSVVIGEDDTVALGPHMIERGDVVWVRRPEPPQPNPKTAEADKKFASLEYRSLYHSIAYLLESLPIWCINKYSASRRIIQKAAQLNLARRCGLKIPLTLMSNSPQKVRDFLARGGRNICKGFTPHVWQKDGHRSVAITETFELTPDRLPVADEVLTFAPAIYQEMVPKEFDVRMVLMGNRIYSYALNNTKKALDWRQDCGFGHVSVDPIATPPEVEQGVLAFAREAGICFGSLDFGVDAEGKWWFLEINEQGQFLWLDQFNRDARILGKFCAFITAPEGSTAPLEAREDLFPTLQEYEDLLEREQVPPVARARQEDPFLSIEA